MSVRLCLNAPSQSDPSASSSADGAGSGRDPWISVPIGQWRTRLNAYVENCDPGGVANEAGEVARFVPICPFSRQPLDLGHSRAGHGSRCVSCSPSTRAQRASRDFGLEPRRAVTFCARQSNPSYTILRWSHDGPPHGQRDTGPHTADAWLPCCERVRKSCSNHLRFAY
jgi:hypothetical protein